ncbi:MarR family winged helix-turn-helix transcriptional regulator [Parasedimentitalea huanghaiensis]|uniref:MarR family transcriptional regulator n=1 Tax=Parasedimentitalea huanghaiensis TaxID=2682100 RepID=A0A6L6WRS2_9RHOB|nr:MarR family transcriptional regulator [Zongyanglinia huanghaiensis]MVO18637.1 MarR family transcriptional regulator [Zongyanglinia huanghaiensis]
MSLDETDTAFQALTMEIRAILGVFALYGKLDDSIEKMNDDPKLAKMERRMIIRLDRPRRMGLLAQMMLTVPSAVTASADSLEEKGHLLRRRDPSDKRAWLLELTDSGKDIRREMEQMAGVMFREASGLNEEEIQIFSVLAGKIYDNVIKTGLPEGLKACD